MSTEETRQTIKSNSKVFLSPQNVTIVRSSPPKINRDVLINQAQSSGAKIVYADTDSIIVDDPKFLESLKCNILLETYDHPITNSPGKKRYYTNSVQTNQYPPGFSQ